MSFSKIALALTLSISLATTSALACSRVVWLGPDGEVITGRSMDWPYAFNSHLVVIPEGAENVGYVGKDGLTWKSRFGTVVVAGAANIGGPIDLTTDGINEQGLAANLLYLAETDFGPMPDNGKPLLVWGAWLQYVLSNYATVAEAVDALQQDPFHLVPVSFGPGGGAHATVHLSLSDPSGDSAVIEYLDGKPVIHHGKEFTVMTNSPTFDKQLTLNNYWDAVDGAKFLPGSHRSEDRFVRARYYLGKLPVVTDERQQVAGVLSVMRNVSVPWGEIDWSHPNLAPTYWRTVTDNTRKVYYFESTLSPNIVWLNLNNLDFSEGSGIRAVAVETDFSLLGNIDAKLTPFQPITYLQP